MLFVEQITPQEPDWMMEMPVFDDVLPPADDEIHVPAWVKADKPLETPQGTAKKPLNTINIHTKEKYLSDVAFDLPQLAYLIAPTGFGKTRYAIGCIEGKKIIVLPSQSQIKQLRGELGATGIKSDVWYEHEQSANADSELILTTPDSFKHVRRVVEATAFYVIGDEIHKIATDGFRRKAFDDFQDGLNDMWRGVLLMTGTHVPLTNPLFEAYTRINIVTPKRAQTFQRMTWGEGESRFDAFALATRDTSKKRLVWLDDKGAGRDDVIASLIANGYKRGEMLCIDSDNQNDELQHEFMLSGKARKGNKIVITTRLLTEGFNIYDEFDEVHMLSPASATHIAQFCARPRAKAAHCIVYHNGDGEGQHVKPQNWADKSLERGNETLLDMRLYGENLNDFSEDAAMRREDERYRLLGRKRLIRATDDLAADFFNSKSHELSHAGITSSAFDSMQLYTDKNWGALSRLLTKHGFTESDVCDFTIPNTPKEQKAIESAKATRLSMKADAKDKREKEHEKLIEQLRKITPEHAKVILRYGSDDYPKEVVKAVGKLVKIAQIDGIGHETAIDIMENNPSTRALNRIVEQFRIQERKKANCPKTLAYYDAFMDKFGVGDVLTSKEINEVTRDLYKRDLLLHRIAQSNDELTLTVTARMFKAHFETKRTSLMIERECEDGTVESVKVNALRITSVNPITHLTKDITHLTKVSSGVEAVEI